jgi:hypothetical protein
VKTNSNGGYVGSDGGDYLLFVSEGVLLAQAFDAETLAIVREPAPVTEERILQFVGSGTAASDAAFSVSETGTLVYREGAGATKRQLVWVDRTGRAIASVGTSGLYTMSSYRRTAGEWLLIASTSGRLKRTSG